MAHFDCSHIWITKSKSVSQYEPSLSHHWQVCKRCGLERSVTRDNLPPPTLVKSAQQVNGK